MYASLKLLVAAPLLLSASFQPDAMQIVQYPAIHQVVCAKGKGTAFRIDGTQFVSVAHVTNLGPCVVKGLPIVGIEEPEDFSLFNLADGYRGGFPINCDGFIPGEYYFAIGYQGGHPVQRMAVLKATIHIKDGRRILAGYPTVLPGMSGGPVLNAQGEVVGTVNTYTPFWRFSGSQELKYTSLCREG